MSRFADCEVWVTERCPHPGAVAEVLMSVPPLGNSLVPFALVTSVCQIDLRLRYDA
jgi:hypothetical protein